MRDRISPKYWGQPLDIAVVVASVLIVSLITLLLWQGDRTAPQIIEFSWDQKQISAKDVAFTLTFNRPMDHQSVEKNLKITPSLPGRISWAGRKLAYTLNSPPVYGDRYQVELNSAYDRFANEAGNHRPNLPFTANFFTPDRAFVYVGAIGAEKNRLIKVNQSNQSHQILTPENLAITNFRIFPDRQRILLGAAPYQSGNINILEQQLYQLELEPKDSKSAQSNQMQLVLDSKEYQISKFELAADGKTAVIQRLSRKQVGQYGLWVLSLKDQLPAPQGDTPARAEFNQPRALESKPGGDFLITPDGSSVAIAQGEGVAILPIIPALESKSEGSKSEASKSEPLDFLPKFGMVLDFSQDGSQAAMVKFNKDYTRSLFFVTNQGVQKELLRISGSILSAVFNPQKTTLYVLLTDADLNATMFQEQPYLAAIALSSGKVSRILDLKSQKDIQIDLSPEGREMLISATPMPENSPENSPRNSLDSKLSDGTKNEANQRSETRPIRSKLKLPPQLFEVSLEGTMQIKSLALTGNRPQWLP